MAATKTERLLDGVRLAITSRLASMSREEARERIAACGGIYDPVPRADTDVLVVGQGGPALGDDGKLTHSLQIARTLQSEGAPIRIVAEQEFLQSIGLEERCDDFHRLYTTEQLQRILDVPSRDIRHWMRHELIQPVRVVNRLCFFDFQQVATARTLCRLARAGVGPQRIRKSLEALRRWLPGSDSALAQLESIEDGGPLLVRTDEGRLAEASGQLRIEFEPEPPAPASSPAETHGPPPTRPPARAPASMRICPQDDAEAQFEAGMQAEADGDLEFAIQAYERALALGGPVAEVTFNLGNTHYALERLEQAAGYFELATRADSSYVEAWNNLGNVLAELERGEEAVSSYRRALSLAPDYADAHYNLAETLAGMGALHEAQRHWRAYLLQDPHSPTAREVRARLAGDPGGQQREP